MTTTEIAHLTAVGRGQSFFAEIACVDLATDLDTARNDIQTAYLDNKACAFAIRTSPRSSSTISANGSALYLE